MADFDLATVKIKHPDGYAVINKSDFDADRHELYGNEEAGGAITRGSLSKMRKDDMAELLETYGADTTGTAAELRERLESLLFSDS